MKLQNIFALIVTWIGFAACTSESELPDTAVNGDLVPVTISLGSIQTKAPVGLDTGEGTIKNAVIGIFDSKGIPTVAPLILNANSGTTRLPLVKSNAYAFVNVSDADMVALKAIGSEEAFKKYAIKKTLTQDATSLPKYGEKLDLNLKGSNANISIDVHQLTARVEAMVDIKVVRDGAEIPNTGLSFSKSSLSWDAMSLQSSGLQTDGINGTFTTTINGTAYTTLNRAYTYPGAMPAIALGGSVVGEMEGFNSKEVSLSYAFPESLAGDHVYLVRFIVKVDISQPANPTFTYVVVNESAVNVDVPSYD